MKTNNNTMNAPTENPKRLLYLTLSAERVLKNSIHSYILDELKKEFEITILCYGDKYQKQEENITYISGNFVNWIKAIKHLNNISLIYANDYFLGGLIGAYLKKKHKISLFIRVGSPWVYEINSPIAIAKTIAVKIIRPFVLKRADLVIYNSQAVVQRNIPHNFEVIYNGVDTNLFKPMKIKPISQKLNLIYVGNLNVEKGLNYLLDAVKDISNQIHLSIVGDGSLLPSLQQKYPFAQFHGRIPREDLPKLINQHDVLVLPTFVESFPNVLLEAMACGKPVIATNVFGIPEMVQNNINGFLVPAKNSSEIKTAVEKFMQQPELVYQLGKNDRKIVEEKFKKEQQIQKIYNVIINLYEKKR